MGLIAEEIRELRQLNRRIDEGTVKPEVVHQKIAVYSQIEKRAKMIMQGMIIAAKIGDRRAMNRLMESNLLDGRIQLEDNPEKEMIHCPDTNKVITRGECLDYSGDSAHYDNCRTCQNFSSTREILTEK